MIFYPNTVPSRRLHFTTRYYNKYSSQKDYFILILKVFITDVFSFTYFNIAIILIQEVLPLTSNLHASICYWIPTPNYILDTLKLQMTKFALWDKRLNMGYFIKSLDLNYKSAFIKKSNKEFLRRCLGDVRNRKKCRHK